MNTMNRVPAVARSRSVVQARYELADFD